MTSRKRRTHPNNSALSQMAVACFADLPEPFQRTPRQNLRALLRHTELGATNAHYAFLQRPNAERFVSSVDWHNLEDRCRLRGDAQPIVVLQPKGPIGFRFDIADLEGDPEAIALIARRARHTVTPPPTLLKRLGDISDDALRRASAGRSRLNEQECEELSGWQTGFARTVAAEDLADGVRYLAAAAVHGVRLAPFDDLTPLEKRTHRNAAFDVAAIEAVALSRLLPPANFMPEWTTLSDRAEQDVDCYFIACAANKICSIMLHSERSLREQELDGQR